MNAVTLKLKKTAKLRVIATARKVNIRFPQQCVGNVALMVQVPKTVFEKGKAPRTVYEDGRILAQWELVLRGHDLKAVKVLS